MDNVGYIKTYEVTIVELGTGKETSLVVEAGEDASTGAFVIRSTLNGQEITSTNDNYFKAFQQFRDKLLEAGYGIRCNGARLNVVSTSMTRNTPEVYIVEPGGHALSKEPVNIWDKADISDFPDSVKQNRFYNIWADEQKKIENREVRKTPSAVKILILTPLIPYCIWWLTAYTSNHRFLPRIDMFLINVGMICLLLSITVGFLMVLIGTVMAIKQKKKLFIAIGLVEMLALLAPVIYVILMLHLYGLGWR